MKTTIVYQTIWVTIYDFSLDDNNNTKKLKNKIS